VKRRPWRTAGSVAFCGLTVFCLAGSCDTDQDDAQRQAQATTNAYQSAATQQVPYPLADMKAGGWSERRLLAEHLKRQNDPKSVRWVVWMSQQGQLIGQWPIQGMVFSPDSQMTNSELINGCPGAGSSCGAVTQAPGDNGTWGPEAGAAAFFTTSGVEIQLPAAAVWVESDAPLNLTDKPLITYDVNDKPSTDHGGVKVGH
jgi:hypothetical protein